MQEQIIHSYVDSQLMYLANNLQVITVVMLGGPAPTLVCALTCNLYTVSGDNPSIVPIKMLLLKLTTVASNWIEYCVIMPLGVTGGLHCKVTELELTEIASND